MEEFIFDDGDVAQLLMTPSLLRFLNAGVQLVPFTEAHITPRYISWLNDKDIVRLSEQRHKTHTDETCRAWLANYMGHEHNRIWAIEVDGVHVGNVTALADPNNHTCEVSNLIGEKSYWGKGIGTEACRQAINHMLDEGYRKEI